MKKYKIGLLFLSAFLFLAFCVGCSSVKESSNLEISSEEAKVEKSHLPLLLTNTKISQETRISQMRADLIKQNNGYQDSDVVHAVIELKEESLIDKYLDSKNSYKSVMEYAQSQEGNKIRSKINTNQNSLIKKLQKQGVITKVLYQYNTILNAIAVETTYQNFKEFEKYSAVSNVILSETYNKPKTLDSKYNAVMNSVDVYETGIFNSSCVSYTGEGTAVAVLDSGFDISHTVFQQELNKVVIKEEDLQPSFLETTNAYRTTSGLLATDVYKSKKIPFAYDYADKDYDVTPFDSNHGTHVAGIIGGEDEKITGVAVKTQLVLLKVFSDYDSGAETPDILAALEDATLLQVDAINMSLGTSCGFSREGDDDLVNKVYDNINKSGISMVVAASNDYNSAYGGALGNTNKVTNPDSATVGSPSTYTGSLSVASISGTLSNYIVGPDSHVFFFNESNSISGKPNDFIKELGIEGETDVEYEYVTVPGVGMRVNYAGIDVKGKIALVRRGDNTFEEKAKVAKDNGAIACIIYNNVAGDILMSMGKSDHIPTISISKDDGTLLAKRSQGTLIFNSKYKAGPFMSDFSSWGPNPDLTLKPEITAHGGNITSAVPGGGYDQISGTSMASPNMCGVVVLIRQYLKEKYPTYSAKQISDMAYQLLMSTATIALNEEGNPYSPRKQGAGLASLSDATTTPAYVTVSTSDKAKLELGDDPKRTGIYEMVFRIENISNTRLSYAVRVQGLTESVSTSDASFVAEKSYLLGGSVTVEGISGVTVDGYKVTVEGNTSAEVKVTYTLSKADKEYLNNSFQYGMYVEGFVILTPDSGTDIDLNVPFLAFYGDWTESPLFDKTYYEVETTAHDIAIDDEDKVKADYYATTPYGSYYYNYIIPLGSYIYDIDTSKYDPIPSTEEHIAVSNSLGTIDGIYAVYAGLLRNAKTVKFTLVDKMTGEVVYEHLDYNAYKAHSNGGNPIPYYESLKMSSYQLGLINNRTYTFKMEALLDYGDGGVNTNARNTFEFDLFMDEEAPIIKDAVYEKVYDKSLKKYRYYITLTVYDNHYVQSVTPILFTSDSAYTTLTSHPIPVYSDRNSDSNVRFEITDYLDELYSDQLITSSLAFSIDDYAFNTNLYLCELPGTKGDFKFTSDGTENGSKQMILPINKGEAIDLVSYLYSYDTILGTDKDYLKYLIWSSSNEKVAIVKEGIAYGLSVGRTTITVSEGMWDKKATIVLNVVDSTSTTKDTIDPQKAVLSDIQFSYFDTLYAHKASGDEGKIGQTGDRKYLISMPKDAYGTPIIDIFPGESIKLYPVLTPWYLPENRYELVYSSTNENVATVDENGIVTTHKKGSCTIKLNIIIDGKQSNIMATLKLSVQSEFVIEGRTLVAYKGVGGNVVIPDDEGILFIGSYAFCLYDVDKSIELTEEDYDANKIPGENETVTSVIIPEGVEDIQKYAFYNCKNLKTVHIPQSAKYIREYSFYNDTKLEEINLDTIEVIGKEAFYNCIHLENISLNKIYAISQNAFEKCEGLTTIDISKLRNSGAGIFKDCVHLQTVITVPATSLSISMFENTAIEEIHLGVNRIPSRCFADCSKLKKVEIGNDLIDIGEEAFQNCILLTTIDILGNVKYIYDGAFSGCKNLQSFSFPNCTFTLGSQVFAGCENLTTIQFKEYTYIPTIGKESFVGSRVDTFIAEDSQSYTSKNGILYNAEETSILLVAPAKNLVEYTVDSSIKKIGQGAFSGISSLEKIIFLDDIIIENYAFANCSNLSEIVFPNHKEISIGSYAFMETGVEDIQNFEAVIEIGSYAFAKCDNLITISIGEEANVLEGAFYESGVEIVTLGTNVQLDKFVFQNCYHLSKVNMPTLGGVSIGEACFSNDGLLSNIDLSKVEEIIAREAFYNCGNLAVANLENIKYIGAYAFSDCGSLETVLAPVVEAIDEGAFCKYDEHGIAPSMMEITLSETPTLTYIGDYAFSGCANLTKFIIPDTVNYFGKGVFSDCTSLKEVEYPDTFQIIQEQTFAGCESLTKVNTENIIYVGEMAFLKCTSLKELDLSSLQSVGYGAFALAPLEELGNLNQLIEIDDFAFQGIAANSFIAENLEYIGYAAFSFCEGLEEFGFSNHIEYVGENAFYGANSLRNFYYIDGNSKITTTQINDYAMVEDGVLYTYLPSGNLELTAVPNAKQIETLEVKDGTYRIAPYSGNENPYIQKIIFPETLCNIGSYAFYGYISLSEVEFRSYVAPILESEYEPNASLNPTDPGYDLLHKYLGLFQLELCYFNFVDLAGKLDPIQMILPSNKNIEKYDGIIYEAYFGKVSSAKRSSFVAKDTNTLQFLKLVELIPATITLSDEKLIREANNYYHALKQDITQFGYSLEEVNAMYEKVQIAVYELNQLKLETASQQAKKLQEDIMNLDTAFTISRLEELQDFSRRISELNQEEKMLLDLTKYDQLVASYYSYCDSILQESNGVDNIVNHSYAYKAIWMVLMASMGLAYAFVLGKKFL